MALYVKKKKSDILRQALQKLQDETPITAIGPGSVARAFTEAIVNEIGDAYDALDYNLAQSVVSTATGRALDLIGSLYNVQRKTVSELTAIDKRSGSFYFYLDSPYHTDITIPAGTRVYSSIDGFVGAQFTYVLTEQVVIPAGRTRAFGSIRPAFNDSVHTAGAGSLTVHNFMSPAGASVKCTNPKSIQQQASSEDDATYRARIIKSVRVAASGTVEAIRFKALSINGVRDIRIRTAPYGLGSFEVILTAEDTTFQARVRREVLSALETVRPVGVTMFVKDPELVPFDITISLITPSLTSAQADVVAGRARIAVIRYLNSLLPGQTLVYNRLVQIVLESSDLISDLHITTFAKNGTETLRKNYKPNEDELVVAGRIEVAVTQ